MNAITNFAGLDLHLKPGQSLTIEQAAGWLSDDELPGAFSYPIGFPLDEHNQKFLQHGYRPDHARPDMQLPVTVQLEGVLYRRCTLSYRITDSAGDGFLKIDAGEVYEKIKKLSLLEALPDVIPLGDGLFSTLESRMLSIAKMNPGEFPLTFFPIRNELFFEADLAPKVTGFVQQPYLNAWSYGGFVPPAPGVPVVPQFYLAWVLERIYALAGYRITGDWIGREETQRLTLLNLTEVSTVSVGFLKSHQATAGLCLPEMSVPDFLKAVRTRYGLVFTFNANEQTVSIRRFVDILKRPTTQDLTRYQLTGYSIDAAGGRGFSVQENPDSSDELYNDAQGSQIKPAPIVLGLGGQTVDMKVSTPQLIYERSPASHPLFVNAKWLVPTMRQPGNLLGGEYKESDRYAEKNPDGSLKRRNSNGLALLSYRGMQPDSIGSPYPLGTPGTRDGRQIAIDGAEATSLAGRGGVYRTSLRSYFYFRDQTRPAVAKLLLPATVLASLKLDEPVALSLEGDVRKSYLPDKIQAGEPGPSGLVQTRLTLLTLPDGLDLESDADEPLVYLEMSSVKRNSPGPLGDNVLFNARELTTVSLKLWANAQRTQAAVVSNLPVLIRRKKTWTPLNSYVPEKLYEETVMTYYVSGSTAVIETDWLTKRAYGRGNDVEIFEILFALDPGDGYIILL